MLISHLSICPMVFSIFSTPFLLDLIIITFKCPAAGACIASICIKSNGLFHNAYIDSKSFCPIHSNIQQSLTYTAHSKPVSMFLFISFCNFSLVPFSFRWIWLLLNAQRKMHTSTNKHKYFKGEKNNAHVYLFGSASCSTHAKPII